MSSEISLENEILYKTGNILIIGPGGCGKSTLIKKVYTTLFAMEKQVYVTAYTGVAAVNVNGQTLHRYFGVGIAKGSITQIINYVKARSPGAIKRIMATEILFIDEISMVGLDLFEKLNKVAQFFRNSTMPFGGIRLILSGDYLQLPPVKEDFVFKSEIYKSLCLVPFILNKPYRFDDPEFFKTLMRIRMGKMTRGDLAKLYQARDAHKEYLANNEPGEIKPTIIYSHKADVQDRNIAKLVELPGELIDYKAEDTFETFNPKVKKDYYSEIYESLAPTIVSLKVGAQVMLTRNLNVDEGLCNGSRGVIKEMNNLYVSVLFRNGQKVDISPIVFDYSDNNVVIERRQLPLILAFAITIHKTQGSTIDYCVMDLGPTIFAPGQAYVALSRARNWNSVLLSKFLPGSIKADPDAVAYVKSIEEQIANVN